jgi:hypothetical protein
MHGSLHRGPVHLGSLVVEDSQPLFTTGVCPDITSRQCHDIHLTLAHYFVALDVFNVLLGVSI